MIFRQLRTAGILGMNARIGCYMNRLNPRKYYPRVDDKVYASQLLQEHGIPVPNIYYVFRSFGDLKKLDEIMAPYDSFAIKPARGAMGHGIVIISNKSEESFVKSSGKVLSLQSLKDHISQTMSGLYSLGGLPDAAMLQHKVRLHPGFEPVTYQGIPDIRIIVFRGYPIMAMMRSPTQVSDGRANLHQGAVGCGIEMSTGQINHAIHHNHYICEHPDTGHALIGMMIPDWPQILLMAARCYEVAKMGYLGVDIVLDAELGPLVLEMNARPGLSIQVANRLGLRKILQSFSNITSHDLSAEARVEVALSRLSEMNL